MRYGPEIPYDIVMDTYGHSTLAVPAVQQPVRKIPVLLHWIRLFSVLQATIPRGYQNIFGQWRFGGQSVRLDFWQSGFGINRLWHSLCSNEGIYLVVFLPNSWTFTKYNSSIADRLRCSKDRMKRLHLLRRYKVSFLPWILTLPNNIFLRRPFKIQSSRFGSLISRCIVNLLHKSISFSMTSAQRPPGYTLWLKPKPETRWSLSLPVIQDGSRERWVPVLTVADPKISYF